MHDEAINICAEHGFEKTDLWRKSITFWSSRADKPEVLKVLEESLPMALKVLPLLAIVALLKESTAPISFIKGKCIVI